MGECRCRGVDHDLTDGFDTKRTAWLVAGFKFYIDPAHIQTSRDLVLHKAVLCDFSLCVVSHIFIECHADSLADTAFRLLREVQFTVIRGNISEIKTLASGAGTTKGVDADVADKVTEENLDSAVAFAKAFAARTGAVVAITGAIDIVADAQKAYCIRNGNAMMSSITGTGCQLSALTAAFVTANPDHPLEAAAAAVCAMGLAGEVAHQRLTPQDGNATYRNYIIDAIYNMTPEQLEKGANYEVR